VLGGAALGGTAGAGATAAGGGGGAGTGWAGLASTGGGGGGAGMVALTALLQAGDRLARFFCRQFSASLPPRSTPGHFDMKSERQFERMALCCSGVGWAEAAPVRTAHAATAAIKQLTTRLIKTPRTSPDAPMVSRNPILSSAEFWAQFIGYVTRGFDA
jgi:hypothetical protein